jgi:hypothetical protein
MMVTEETREVIPNKAMICNVIKDKQSPLEQYTWFVKTVLTRLDAMSYTKMVKIGKIKPSDIISATDEKFMRMSDFLTFLLEISDIVINPLCNISPSLMFCSCRFIVLVEELCH